MMTCLHLSQTEASPLLSSFERVSRHDKHFQLNCQHSDLYVNIYYMTTRSDIFSYATDKRWNTATKIQST